MSFDLITPKRGMRPPGADEVRVTMGRSSSKALECRIVIGTALCTTMGLSKGQRVNLLFGRGGTPDRGCIVIEPAADGLFRLTGGKSLECRTRTLHPTLAPKECSSTPVKVVQVTKERLVARLPADFLAPSVPDSIMGQPARKAG